MDKTILIALLGSGVISALISGLFGLINKAVDRKNAKADANDDKAMWRKTVDRKLEKSESDNVRLQMLVMISDYPDECQEILRLAEHYFRDLHGNWYMTSIFNQWLHNKHIAEPEWFDRKGA